MEEPWQERYRLFGKEIERINERKYIVKFIQNSKLDESRNRENIFFKKEKQIIDHRLKFRQRDNIRSFTL